MSRSSFFVGRVVGLVAALAAGVAPAAFVVGFYPCARR